MCACCFSAHLTLTRICDSCNCVSAGDFSNQIPTSVLSAFVLQIVICRNFKPVRLFLSFKDMGVNTSAEGMYNGILRDLDTHLQVRAAGRACMHVFVVCENARLTVVHIQLIMQLSLGSGTCACVLP